MGEQYIRNWSLTVDGNSGGLEFGNLRCRFHIMKDPIQRPNYLEATVTNVSKATAKRLLDKEFSKVSLSAGYRGNATEIFNGQIYQIRYGRETPTDTYLTINAQDGGRGYKYAAVNKTLKSGSTGRDVYNALAEAMKPYDIVQGEVSKKLDELKFPRPVVLFGNARRHLRWLAGTIEGMWSIQDGKLDLMHKDESKEGQAVVVNALTGMIGAPEQTQNGIIVRALINPRIAVLRKIQLNNKSIQQAAFDKIYFQGQSDFGVNDPRIMSNPRLPQLDTDGIYRVLKIDWQGDTRGNPWYMDMVCVADNKGAPIYNKQTARWVT